MNIQTLWAFFNSPKTLKSNDSDLTTLTLIYMMNNYYLSSSTLALRGPFNNTRQVQ